MKSFILLFLASQMLLFSEMKIEFLTTDFYGSTIFNNNIYCYGKYGVVLTSPDTGISWSRVNLDIKDNIIGSFNTNNTLYLYSNYSIYKLEGTKFFTKLNLAKDWSQVFNITAFNDTVNIFTDIGIYKTVDFSYFIKTNNFNNKCNYYFNESNTKFIMTDSNSIYIWNKSIEQVENIRVDDKIKSIILQSDYDKDKLYMRSDSGIFVYDFTNNELKFKTNKISSYFKVNNGILYNPMYSKSNKGVKTTFSEFKDNTNNIFNLNLYIDTLSQDYGTDINLSYIIEPADFNNYYINNNLSILVGTKNTIYLSKNNGKTWILNNHFGYLFSGGSGLKFNDNILLNSGQNLINSNNNGVTWKPLSLRDRLVPYNNFILKANNNNNILINQQTERNDRASTLLINNYNIIDTAVNYENFILQTYISNIPVVEDTFFVAANRNFQQHYVVDFYIFKNSAKSIKSKITIDSSSCLHFFERDKSLYALCVERKEYKNTSNGFVPTKYNNILYRFDFSNEKVEAVDTLNSPFYTNYYEDNVYLFDKEKGELNIYNMNNKGNDKLLIRQSYLGNLSIKKINDSKLLLFLDSIVYCYDKKNNQIIEQLNVNRLIPDWNYGYETSVLYTNYSNFNFVSVVEDSSFITTISLFNNKNDNLGVISIPSFDDYLIRITPSKATSIESPQIEENAYLYTYPPRPNPATQSVSAEVYWNSAYTLSESNISVYDIYGSKYNSNITFTSKEPFRAIINADCSNLATGIYFIRISVNGEYKTIPFTVVR